MMAISLDEMTLSPEAAAEFERILSQPAPPGKPHPKMEQLSPGELKRRLRK
jgi:hypothetical protein